VLIVGIADTCDSEFHNLLSIFKDTENNWNYQIKNIMLHFHFRQT